MVEELVRALHITHKAFYSILSATLIVSSLLSGLVLNRIVHYWTKKFRNQGGEFLFAFLEALPIPLLLLIGLYIGLESLPLPRGYEQIGSKFILALVLLVIAYLPAKFLILALQRLGEKSPAAARAAQPAAYVIRTAFALLAIIIFLEDIGIKLTVVWTTLGVGSVAIALALQDTLGNFFSGLYLMADRPVSPGDYIRTDSNQEGYVQSIGWRSTTLRTLGENLVIIPNSTLAKAVITNFSLPQPRVGYGLQVNVAYGTDTAQVEKALLEVAQDALRDGLEGLLPRPEPSVAFLPGFGDFAMNFTLNVALRRFADQYSVQSDLRKRVVKKFREAGIEIPFPTRTLILEKALQSDQYKPRGGH